MRHAVVALHVGIVITALMPMYSDEWWRLVGNIIMFFNVSEIFKASPLGQLLQIGSGSFHISVIAAGLPSFLAILNIPLLFVARTAKGLWRPSSSVVLGLLTMSVFFHLGYRYGWSRAWGVEGGFGCGFLLTAAGSALLFQKARGDREEEEPSEGWMDVSPSPSAGAPGPAQGRQ